MQFCPFKPSAAVQDGSLSLFWEGIDLCSASHVKASVKYVFITLNSSFVSVRVMRSTWKESPNRIQLQTEMGEKRRKTEGDAMWCLQQKQGFL